MYSLGSAACAAIAVGLGAFVRSYVGTIERIGYKVQRIIIIILMNNINRQCGTRKNDCGKLTCALTRVDTELGKKMAVPSTEEQPGRLI